MTLQERYRADDSPARGPFAHVLEALGFYQALAELGVNVRLKQIDDFDWRAASGRPRLVILPHVSALTATQAAAVYSRAYGTRCTHAVAKETSSLQLRDFAETFL